MSYKRLASGPVLLAILMLYFPIVAGCGSDNTTAGNGNTGGSGGSAPFPPTGVFSITGDGEVEILWLPNWEADIAGYAVFRHDPLVDPVDRFNWLVDVAADQTIYIDTDISNGQTMFYAVLAFNDANQESELSYENVFDTPRPEGTVILRDYMGPDSLLSGYNFASLSGTAQAWDRTNPPTDVYFGFSSGVPTLFSARAEVDVQPFGWIGDVENFWWLDWSPGQGWAPSKTVELILGHTYALRIEDSASAGDFNFAKLFVQELNTVSDPSVRLVWAYQTDVNNPELSPGGGAMR